MTIPELLYHEYLPSPRSMADQMYDVKSVIKQKYLKTINQDYSPLPYKLLQVDYDARDLSALLHLYTAETLKNIAQTISREIKYNIRKDLLIPVLVAEIIKSFGFFLTIMNDDPAKHVRLNTTTGRRRST